MSHIDLLTLFNSSVAGITAPSHPSQLSVPSNAHVFHKYYKTHYSYTYRENYSFQDKVWIFDGRKKTRNVHASRLFQDIKYNNTRTFDKESSSEQRYNIDHSFIDWSQNGDRRSLKDILMVDSGYGTYKPFTPFTKNVFLDYSYSVNPKYVPIYAYYFDGATEENQYNNIRFGKQKSNPQVTEQSVPQTHTGSRCTYQRNSYIPSNFSLASKEEGFDGVCDHLNLTWGNHNFYYDRDSSKWITPYSAYKYFLRDGWNEQYYLFFLGNFVKYRNTSTNLMSHFSDNRAWSVNYDDVFALSVSDDNKLVLKLNENAETIKDFEDSEGNVNSEKFSNFFRISSYLDFTLTFHHLGKEITKTFDMKDVLENKVVIDVPNSTDQFHSTFLLSASPKPDSNAVLANSVEDENKYMYSVNLDNLIRGQKLFDRLEFSMTDRHNVLPSQLLSTKTLSQYFQLVDKNGAKTPLNPEMLRLLDPSVQLDDSEGTATLTYHFRGEEKTIELSGLRSVPKLAGKFYVESIEDALDQLRKKYPNEPEYFWNNLSFSKTPMERWNKHKFSVSATFSPKMTGDNIVGTEVNGEIRFHSLDIELLPNKDIFPIQKTASDQSVYQNLSELFEVNDYALSIGLTPENYTYKLINNYDHSFEVLASVTLGDKHEVDIPVGHRQKLYVFEKKNFNVKGLTQSQTSQEGAWEWFNKPENAAIAGAGTSFSGATGLYALSKLKGFRFKRA